MNLFHVDGGFRDYVEEQYYLAKEVNIQPSESGEMLDFERKMYTAFLIRDKKEKLKALKKSK